MAQRRKSTLSKAELVTTNVKSIEITSKKQLGKINSMRRSEAETLHSECDRVKAELELVKNIDPDTPGWRDQALGIADHMKSIVRRESELQHQMLLKADEVAKELEMKIKPIKKELPMILDFSEEDRVHLNLTMDKALHEIAKRRREIEEDELRLQKQMSVLIHNTPDPSAPKEETIMKLKTAYETIVNANDPETLRMEVLANIDGTQQKAPKNAAGPKGPLNKPDDKLQPGRKKSSSERSTPSPPK